MHMLKQLQRTSTCSFAAVLCALLVVQYAVAQPVAAPGPAAGITARFCTSDAKEQAECGKWVVNLNALQQGVTYGCAQFIGAGGCLQAIANGSAEMRAFDSTDMIRGNQLGLEVIVAENYAEAAATPDFADYYAVAAVPAAFCNRANVSLASLKGLRSCHTGYQRSAGWTVPIGILAANKLLTPINYNADVAPDAESAAAFFSKTCAARASGNGPKLGPNGQGVLYPPLCTGCATDCTENDPYYDYSGAFRCLTEGAGDVAFFKHTTILDDAKDGLKPLPWANKTISEFRLLCANGGCATPDQYRTCNLARVPAHGVLVNGKLAPSVKTALQTALVAASKTPSIKSTLFNKKGNDYLFKSSAVELRPITVDTATFVGGIAAAFASLDALLQTPLQPKTARFCTISAEEQTLCMETLPLFQSLNDGLTYGCVQANGSAGCLEAIATGAADMRAFDGGDAHKGSLRGLEAIVAENYGGEEGTDYYAVAAVPASFCNSGPSLGALRGKRSCHTGYGKTAGWVVPVGVLAEQRLLTGVNNDATVEPDAESVASFFSRTCAPRASGNGPMNGPNGMGQLWAPLCAGCAGNCSEADPYYDYSGAFRCLTENAGDVAFVKHTTLLDDAKDGKKPQSWATRSLADFRLLCPTGGCMTPDKWKQCNLARVPAHAVLVNAKLPYKNDVRTALVAAAANPLVRAALFNKKGNDLLFKSSATGLTAINGTTEQYVGPIGDIFDSVNTLLATPLGSTTSTQSSTSSGGSDDSGTRAWAIAMTVIGSLALLACAVQGVIIYRMRKGYNKYTGDAKLFNGGGQFSGGQ